VIKLIYKFCLLFSSTVVSLNEFDFNFLAQTGFVDKNKLVLINGEGVNIEYFDGCPSINSNEFFEFLFIGRIIKEKGILDFIAAAKKIIYTYPDYKVKFSILGSFDRGNRSSLSENEFYNEIGLFSQISYLGYESDVRGYIDSCDCVVLPSYREGLSRVLLEAASMYKPIITSNVPGCSDLVVDGINGYLCEAKDYISLSDAMYKMFVASEQLKFSMGVSSRILVEKKYSSKIINNELFDLIRL
jgi:glycosyltransferase involved in cell wall biosynthesis